LVSIALADTADEKSDDSVRVALDTAASPTPARPSSGIHPATSASLISRDRLEFQVSTPSWGVVVIAVAQVNETIRSGIIAGTATTTLNQTGLDGFYPYSPWVSSNQAWVGFDAPADNLETTSCTTLTRNDTFTDFFVYQDVQQSRPSIPITVKELTWA
jgi:hypothetical protein